MPSSMSEADLRNEQADLKVLFPDPVPAMIVVSDNGQVAFLVQIGRIEILE